MVRLSGIVECDQGAQTSAKARLFCCVASFRALRAVTGLGKPPRFGVGGRQRIEHFQPLPATKLVRPLRMLDRRGAVSQRRLRAGRQQPSQVSVGLRVVGVNL